MGLKMRHYLLVQAIPFCIAFANFCLAGIVLTARRHRPEHWWMAAIATAAGTWGLGISLFLLSNDEAVATIIVRIYYLAAISIPFSLIGFCLAFPKIRKWSKLAYGALLAGFLGTVAIAFIPGAVIKDIIISSNGNAVVPNPPYYRLFALYFIVYLSIATYLLVTNYLDVKRHHHRQFLRQMRTMLLGMALSVGFGLYFNLFLPFMGDYNYLWAGPLFTILFVVALFYAIIKERLFDLRAALARTTAYFMLVASLAALYWFAIYGITSAFFLGKEMTELYAAIYVGVALVITLTYGPLKRLIDHQTHRLFYRSEYNLTEITQQFSDITAEEIQLSSLVHRSLELLDRTLAPEYITAYVMDANGTLHHYSTESRRVGQRQRKAQLDIVTMLLDRMPRVVDAYDINSIGDSETQHLVKNGQVSMILQFVVQQEHIGALFIGDKRNGRPYDEKDLQLLRTTTDELALAIQNSLRFGEIQNFNETLKEKISVATKKLRHTNRELHKLDEAKDEFLSMASHQLRTPLTSIKGYLSMVMEGDAGKISDQQRQLLSEAFNSSERMVHLIADFLSVSRLQTGKFIIDTQPVDLSELVRHEVEALTPLATSHGLKIDFTSPVARRQILIDEDKVQQVVMNLLDNAIFYSRGDSTIKVDLAYVGKEVVFTVKDTGIGVPVTEQKKLFAKFFRATNARQQRPDGTGVGLYLAKKVVTAHGGSIVFSSQEGKGSTFGFRIPINPPESAPTP